MFSTLSKKRLLLNLVTFGLVWNFLYVYVLVDFNIALSIAFVDSLFTHLPFVFTAFLVFITLKYYQPSKENFFYLRVWVLLLAIGNTIVIVNGLGFIYASNSEYLAFIEKSLVLRFCYQLLLGAIITLLLWLLNYLQDHGLTKDRAQESERIAKEAELYYLRQQLQPHFLFNSLNSISALAGSKPEQARKMIEQLSEFLRHTLRKDEQQLISLSDELHQLNLYLEIEKVRFGSRLKSSIICDPNCQNLLLPVLILQPLVENAIKFGLYDTLGEVEISIEVKAPSKHILQVNISNPFDPASAIKTRGTGFGLDSIKRRLYLLFANNNLVRTEIHENIFTVSVSIPQNEKL